MRYSGMRSARNCAAEMEAFLTMAVSWKGRYAGRRFEDVTSGLMYCVRTLG